MRSKKFVKESVLQMQANADHPNIYTITRNDRIYDRLCPQKYVVNQIARSYANDIPGDLFRVWDDKANVVAEFKITVIPPKTKAKR